VHRVHRVPGFNAEGTLKEGSGCYCLSGSYIRVEEIIFSAALDRNRIACIDPECYEQCVTTCRNATVDENGPRPRDCEMNCVATCAASLF
jgi:hypothetical protein